MSKRCVTLIEVIVAMALTSLILMAMLYFYKDVVVIGAEIDKIKIEQFHIRYAENRLGYVLTRTVGAKDKLGDFAFFSLNDAGIGMKGSQTLVFSFDNGICLDKIFSNDVVGRLLLMPNGDLSLIYWPIPKRWTDSMQSLPMKQEVLLKGVQSLSFEFFVAPPTTKPKTDPKLEQKSEAKNVTVLPSGWYPQLWMQEFSQLPAMVKVMITMTENDEKLLYVFPLAKNTAHIVMPNAGLR